MMWKSIFPSLSSFLACSSLAAWVPHIVYKKEEEEGVIREIVARHIKNQARRKSALHSIT